MQYKWIIILKPTINWQHV